MFNYVGKKYGNTENGETVTITEEIYDVKNKCLWLYGRTQSGGHTFGPYYFYQERSNQKSLLLGLAMVVIGVSRDPIDIDECLKKLCKGEREIHK